jgi:hypothetical protein
VVVEVARVVVVVLVLVVVSVEVTGVRVVVEVRAIRTGNHWGVLHWSQSSPTDTCTQPGPPIDGPLALHAVGKPSSEPN